MKELRIIGLHPSWNSADAISSILRFNPEKHEMKFVLDNNHPDYVLVPNQIYTDKTIFDRYKSLLVATNYKIISIFFAGEAVTPDFNIFDYAYGFDRYLNNGDRFGRLTTCRFYPTGLYNWEGRDRLTQDEILKKKTKFCNFIYSHSYGFRDELFYKISEYKRVDSLGKHLNNTKIANTRYDIDWRRKSIEERIDYKFSIAAENAFFPGYTSEKLLYCLEALTVPIYWGDPSISKEFNTDRFINVHDYDSLEAVIERIKLIDNNDELFFDMLCQPWHTSEQLEYIKMQDDEYDKWVLNIFQQDKDDARRAPIGTYPNMYRNWLSNRYEKSAHELAIMAALKIRSLMRELVKVTK